MRSLRVALAQINTTVGDFAGNTAKIREYIDRARSLGADLVAFPEMAITGYPPEDLLLKTHFIQENLRRRDELLRHTQGIVAVVGFVDAPNDLYNAAAIIADGNLCGVYHKAYLPNYGVFDEDRYFRPGSICPIFTVKGIGVGVNICEDIWHATGPIARQASAEAQIIININASPYHAGKGSFRETMLATRASDNTVIVCYVNLVGGQDELVFDGGSLIFNEKGQLLARGKQFEEDLMVVDLDVESVFRTRLRDPRGRQQRMAQQASGQSCPTIPIPQVGTEADKTPLARRDLQPYDMPEEVYHALVLGTRDYVNKNGFKKVVIGLSGGIDSSIVAVIAVDALGPENVLGVSMPSRYSSPGSKSDAQLLAHNLGMKLLTIPIEKTFTASLDTLSEAFAGTPSGVAEENLQARLRGNLLMALSNKFGWLVLTTGNKSEMATGYATLYGDMAGGLAVIKDVPKTLVYKLSHYRNAQAGRDLIPQSVIAKEPTAELRPNQRDVDSLPPYEVLDPILEAYIEEDKGPGEIVALGFDPAMVHKVVTMVDRNEYKRRQSPPGIKITPKAFGRDRRLPITSRYQPFPQG
ncbi:MAG: NAD+ synthase [Chloroflexi bacterium]|nr:NAD+ synthase [Chloroflexota bacterium]